jgi:alkanesulfonate monooxygenase SsuD/methylene tetrahydromethanopterin reductase-like flavin-dependent oxidoreductase (luciferase family)
VVRETMLAMQTLWTQEVASFSGEFVRFRAELAVAEADQQPRPRVLLGGAPGPTLFRHIAEYGDGWLPIGGAGLAAALEQLREAFSAAGRDPRVAPRSCRWACCPRPRSSPTTASTASPNRCCACQSAPRDTVMPVLDRFAREYL